jgi:hypothetical protein
MLFRREMPDVNPRSVRKLALSTELPRLAPIEEIDATTDLTRDGRKRPFMSIPDGLDDVRDPRPAEPAHDEPLFPKRFDLGRGWVLFAFLAGFTLGLSAIGIARAFCVHAPASAVGSTPLSSTTRYARAKSVASSTDTDSL